MNIYHDELCRYCIDARELYEEMSVWMMTGMSYQEWFKYMIESGFSPDVDYVKRNDGKGYLLTIDTAKKFCRITASKIADEHDCFNEIFMTYLVQDVIDGNVYRQKEKEVREYVEDWELLMKNFLNKKFLDRVCE